jgi:hypothetical protein
MRLADLEDVEARRGDLEAAVSAWMTWKDG